MLNQRGPPNRQRVADCLLARAGINHQRDIAIHHSVDDMRPGLEDLVDGLTLQASSPQRGRGPACRQQQEPHAPQMLRHGDHRLFLQITHADKHHPRLGQVHPSPVMPA
nr:hypothetical protein [Enhygromyxa salina]